MNEEMTDLMHKHLNSTLTPAEAALLANAMLENPGLAEEFAALSRLDADLSGVMKDGERTALYTRRMERAAEDVEPVAPRKRWPLKTMAAVAGIAVVTGAALSVLGEIKTTLAKKGKPGVPGGGGGGTYASVTGVDNRVNESTAMKKRLRRFYVPVMQVRSQPVSQALSQLQEKWRSAAPKDDREAASFTVALSEKLRQRWLKPEDEPVVSLEIPGVSLLTNLELVAAQAGLKPVITAGGVTMEEESRPADGNKERKWTIALPKASFAAFISKASQEIAAAGHGTAHGNVEYSFVLPESSYPVLSWMKAPRGVDNYFGYQPLTTWNDQADYILTRPDGAPVPAQPETMPAVAVNGTIVGIPVVQERGESRMWTSFATSDDNVLPVVNAFPAVTDPSQALLRLLSVHGMPADGVTYDAEAGVITAKGSLQNLHAANAAAAAVLESSGDALQAEMKIIEWDGEIPLSTTAGGQVIAAADVSALLRQPNAGIANAPRDTTPIGQELTIRQTPKSLLQKGGKTTEETPPEVTLKISGSRPGVGDTLGIQVNVSASPSAMTYHLSSGPLREERGQTPPHDAIHYAVKEPILPGESQLLPPPAGGQTVSLNLTMSSEGGWMRFDFPSGIGSSHPATVLVRAQSATVDR
ncbi:MAG TPA: hypothetical protein VHM91_18170 [Verrucomicrobiales bacterium]|nr:hypothetical protein [Verrucomicrobiales bacterium]